MSHWSLGAELIRPGQQLPFSSAKHETCCPELHPSSLPSANFSDSQSQAPSAGEHCLWHLSPGAYSDPLGLTSGGSSHRVTALLKLPISEHTLVIQPHSWAPPKQATSVLWSCYILQCGIIIALSWSVTSSSICLSSVGDSHSQSLGPSPQRGMMPTETTHTMVYYLALIWW